MRTKKIVLLCFTFLSIVTNVALAYDVKINNIYYNLDANSKTATVTSLYDNYTSSDYTGSIVIPEEITYKDDIYNVTIIDDRAFYCCSGLVSVSIPNSVTTIYDNAFNGCRGLTKAEFASIESLCSIRFVGEYSNPLNFAHHLFIDGKEVTDLLVPNGVTSIGNYAFRGCSNLKSISIPNSVTEIGGSAFYGCSALTSFVIPPSVTSINYETFYGCSSLTSLMMPDGITKIGREAFFGCKGLTSLDIPEGVTEIGHGAFYNCKGLTSFIIPKDVTTIYYETFYNCSALRSVSIPENVVSIGREAFYGCSGLEAITIPKNVTSIGSSAFHGCNRLISITINSNVIASMKSSSSYSYLSGVFGSQVKEYVFGNGVESIGDYACYNNTNLISLNMGDSVKSIGNFAFSGCSELTSIFIPKGTNTIGTSAFANCNKITSVTIPEGVISIGNSAFSKCTGLACVTLNSNAVASKTYTLDSNLSNIFGSQVKEYVFGNSVESIGGYACYNIINLTSVKISNSITSIGQRAFEGCGLIKTEFAGIDSYLRISFSGGFNSSSNPLYLSHHLYVDGKEVKDLFIPNNVTLIASSAFEGCSSLVSVSIGNSVTSIANRAFEGCSGLTSVTIGNSVTSIGDRAFRGCSDLTSVVIGKSVTSIGINSFEGCSSLTIAGFASIENYLNISFSGGFNSSSNPLYLSHHLYIDGKEVKELIIPNSVTSIGYHAFSGCSGLTSLSIPDGVTLVNDFAFANCSGLTFVDIGKSVSKIGQLVFSGCSSLTLVNINSNAIASKSHTSSSNLSGIFGEQVSKYVFGEEVKGIGEYACYNNTGLTSVTIPNSVTSIGSFAFAHCRNLTSVSIPNNTTSIGNSAFMNCSGLISVQIPENVTSMGAFAFSDCSNLESVDINNSIIGEGMFSGCIGLSSVNIHEDVKTISGSAFSNCKSLASLVLPDGISTIGNNAFPSTTSLYVSRGAKTLLTLWTKGYIQPYETGTTNVLAPPSLGLEGTTQMTVTVKVNSFYPEFTNTMNDEKIETNYKTFYLRPEYSGKVSLKVSKDDVVFIPNSINFTTKSISPTAKRIEGTASSMSVEASYLEGDAPVTAQALTVNGVTAVGNTLYLNGLRPGCSYPATYKITVDDKYEYTKTVKLSTDALQFTNAQPKVISEGNVIVASTSNLDDEETGVGFEWRRTDWTDDFQSNVAGAYLYEGTIEGYIRNMNTNYLWKFRPYYEANDGSRFYGDWLGIDPTNTSYFEPTVHTYAKIEVNGNTAKVKGYAMRGSDNITSQGFMYWRNASSTSEARMVPASAVMVEAKGQVMTSELKDLDYQTAYRIVAYVTTSEGETFYGEEQTFTTGKNPTGIEDLTADGEQETTPEGIYDLNGRKLARMQKGINLVRKADGTVRKVMIM